MTSSKSLDVILDALRAHQCDPQQNGKGWKAKCPAHNDERPSLDIDLGDDGKVLVICRSQGCSFDSIVSAIGLEKTDFSPSKDRYIDWNHRTGNFIYLYADRSVAYRVERFPVYDRKGGVIIGKEMPQSRPDGKSGWIKGRGGIKPILYNLPEITQADPAIPVHIVEGEGKVDRLMLLGRLATCNTGGQGKNKWKDSYSEILRGRHCLIFPDNDQPGREHGQRIAQSLHGKAASIKVVELPGLPHKGDVIDFLDAGGTVAQLDELAKKAPEWAGSGNESQAGAASSGTVDPSAEAKPVGATDTKEKPKREPDPTQADILLKIASIATLFRDDGNKTYAAVPVSNHIEVHAIYSTSFGQWLLREYRQQMKGRMPTAEALKTARDGLDAEAAVRPIEQVFLRVGEAGGNIYIDMGDPDYRAIEINAGGWRIIDNQSVRFRRSDGMKPLPMPTRGGSIEDLLPFLNIPKEEFSLLTGWLASCLLPQGPYPILTLIGEQGCGKSTMAEICKRLVDPQKVKRSSPPKTSHDLAISADNRWVLSYENLTSLPDWLSDMLCTCSTGGGYSTRTLYKDRDEELFDFQRPVILNGISDFITEHADLTDRGVFLHMAPIERGKRRAEKEFWAKFDTAIPSIFGALLDAVVGGLARQSETANLPSPRMSDFGLFAEAVWRGLGHPDNEFLDTYSDNRKDAIASVLEDSPVGVGVMRLMSARDSWSGTATELLEALNGVVSEKIQKSKRWPKRPNALSNAIRRVSPSLRENGISVAADERTDHGQPRKIVISKAPPEDKGKRSAASAASAAPTTAPSKTEENRAADGAADGAADLLRGRSSSDLEKQGSAAPNPSGTNTLSDHAAEAADEFPSSSGTAQKIFRQFLGDSSPGFEGTDWTKYP